MVLGVVTINCGPPSDAEKKNESSHSFIEPVLAVYDDYSTPQAEIDFSMNTLCNASCVGTQF